MIITAALASATPLSAAPDDTETKAEKDRRMEWFREARFGMFIHWGLYAVPAGEWQGNTDHAEWIRDTARIPLEEYNKFLGQFNPTQFDADAWARMAKRAGMKYLVITSKHHDGFCLWDSKLTDWDVMSTPFKRDILKELERACRKQGIRFNTYHSIMDWHHPDYLPRRGWEKDRPTEGADFGRFQAYLKGQLKEIVSAYHPGIMWFDGEWESTWTHEMGKDLFAYVRGLDPKIIVNNRVDKGRSGMAGLTKDGGFKGDYGTPEQEIPAKGLPGVDWESCMTMNNHWGWNKADKNWKTTEDLVCKLIDIASKGGNFLLNVGPKPDGTFPVEAIERLEGIGRWMDKNSEAIYETTASPFARLRWGRATVRAEGKATTLYLHVFDWPQDGRLVVPGLKSEPAKAWLLASGSKVSFQPSDAGLVISLPRQAPDPISTTIALRFKQAPEIDETAVLVELNSALALPAADAELHGNNLRYESGNGKDNLGYWLDPSDWAEWKIKVTRPGKYAVSVDAAAQGDSNLQIGIGQQTLKVGVPNTGDYTKFKVTQVGTIDIPAAANLSIAARAVAAGWQPVNLRAVHFKPVQ
jgi:alpha-L-fucosidase